MPKPRPQREDERREWTLWLVLAADMTGTDPSAVCERFEVLFAEEAESGDRPNDHAGYRVERLEDYFPALAAWNTQREGILGLAVAVSEHRESIDAEIQRASPRWRIERMPVVDRTLLRMGVGELTHFDTPRPRATINGMIELAKRYGAENTPRFVNGILDQIRRNLDIPFA